METSVFNTLVIVAFGLLTVVTGGVVYLTWTDWRDRRRREQENRQTQPQIKPAKRRK